MGNTASLPARIVLKRSITYPQTLGNLEQTKERSMEKSRRKKWAWFEKRGCKTSKGAFLISFKARDAISRISSFNSRGNVVLLKAQLLNVFSYSSAGVI